MEGMTLGYGINLRKGCRTRKLLSHECRHVHQYEEAGSIELFLNEYLTQVATYSYELAPLELDAYKFQLL
jgi:hypothetical protein